MGRNVCIGLIFISFFPFLLISVKNANFTEIFIRKQGRQK